LPVSGRHVDAAHIHTAPQCIDTGTPDPHRAIFIKDN